MTKATGVIQKETGAKLMVMDADVAERRAPRRAVPARMWTACCTMATRSSWAAQAGGASHAGPHQGCTTWTMQVQDGARTLNAVIVGSPNVNPGYILVGNKNYPRIADDYVKTFAVLKSLPCDLFLGAHGAYFGMMAKYEKMKAGARRIRSSIPTATRPTSPSAKTRSARSGAAEAESRTPPS